MNNDTKAVITLVVVAFLILGMVIWGTAGADIRPNVVSGLFTLASAIGAVFIAFYQLRRQGVNTIKANRKNEEMKLKKEIYLSVMETCDVAVNDLNALKRHSLEAWAELDEYKNLQTEGRPLPSEPQFSVKKFAKMYEAASASMVTITNLIESWTIVEPKIRIFRQAFDTSAELKRGAFATFITGAHRYFNARTENGWHFEGWFAEDCRVRQQMLQREIHTEISYIYDFKIAMQNALLGRLFRRQIPLRPPNPESPIIIDIDRPGEVSRGLDQLRSSGRPFDTGQR